MTVWHTVTDVLNNTYVQAALKFLIVTFLGWLVQLVRTHLKQQRTIIAEQQKTVDLLDTETPGGLAELMPPRKKLPAPPK